MYKRILIPLDGSALAERALPHALDIARRMSSEVLLMRVTLAEVYIMSPAGAGALYPEEVLRQERQAAVEYLENIRAQLAQDHPSLTIATEVLSGSVAETIIDYAREHGMDLIVMSTHGRSGLSRWVYGSVADKVLRGAQCPTLIVRGQPAA